MPDTRAHVLGNGLSYSPREKGEVSNRECRLPAKAGCFSSPSVHSRSYRMAERQVARECTPREAPQHGSGTPITRKEAGCFL